jgi:hypothetical protein
MENILEFWTILKLSNFHFYRNESQIGFFNPNTKNDTKNDTKNNNNTTNHIKRMILVHK